VNAAPKPNLALPKISVVTPAFNSVHTVRETIESVLRQRYSNLEHIVMDGGSTDGTVDILKEYPHLVWVSEKDRGHYHAMNKGIQRASGEIVNILNADDCYRDGALVTVGEAFHNHPDWDALFGDIRYVDARGNQIYRRYEAVYDYDVLRFSGVCYVIHQTLFVKKAVHDRIGLYLHERFRNSCDYEFILRMGREGCRVGHVPALLIDYRYHDYGQSADLRITTNMAREALIIRREHGFPDGWKGKVLVKLFKAKRQMQKLLYRGRCDLISGRRILRRHMRAKTKFSSNIGLDKLPEVGGPSNAS
jgi:glycosyltransferase involved in cell wall biosynthesis